MSLSSTPMKKSTSLNGSITRSRLPVAVLGLFLVCNSQAFQGRTTYAFSGQQQHQPLQKPQQQLSLESLIPNRHPFPNTPSTKTASYMTFGDVAELYQTHPLETAVVTCGLKASVADCIAQVQAWGKNERVVEMRRNMAYILYGGIFIGLMAHLEYNLLFPILFGTEQSLQLVIEKVIFDDFISAPLMWLPPAYFIKALLFDYSLEEGLRRYIRDIRDEGLLLKYWSIWVPGQCITFSVVPEHFRVAFMAAISFFWFILFSSVSSKKRQGQQQLTEQQ